MNAYCIVRLQHKETTKYEKLYQKKTIWSDNI